MIVEMTRWTLRPVGATSRPKRPIWQRLERDAWPLDPPTWQPFGVLVDLASTPLRRSSVEDGFLYLWNRALLRASTCASGVGTHFTMAFQTPLVRGASSSSAARP